MKKVYFITAIFVLLFAINVQAQTGSGDNPAKIGFGVTLTNVSEAYYYAASRELPAPGFTMPIQISPRFRIEPQIGWNTFSTKQEVENQTNETSGHVFQIGIGVFPTVKKDNVFIYYGVRGGYSSATIKEENVNPFGSLKHEESLSGFYIAPATGGEYYFSPHLSAGGEIQLRYSKLSEDVKNDTKADSKSSHLMLRGLVIVRFYL